MITAQLALAHKGPIAVETIDVSGAPRDRIHEPLGRSSAAPSGWLVATLFAGDGSTVGVSGGRAAGIWTVTGRRLAEDALVGPMERIGWTTRARGWFTWSPEPGFVGVVTLNVATDHAAAGTAYVAPHIGVRHDEVERLVCRLAGIADTGYRARTATCALGCVTPADTSGQWLIDDKITADVAAEEIAAAVRIHGCPTCGGCPTTAGSCSPRRGAILALNPRWASAELPFWRHPLAN